MNSHDILIFTSVSSFVVLINVWITKKVIDKKMKTLCEKFEIEREKYFLEFDTQRKLDRIDFSDKVNEYHNKVMQNKI